VTSFIIGILLTSIRRHPVEKYCTDLISKVMDHYAVRLSCEQCRRRKTKCDKEAPCSACQNAGFSCNTVQRARLPRGRSALHRSKALDTRVARLEELVRQLKVNSIICGCRLRLLMLGSRHNHNLAVTTIVSHLWRLQIPLTMWFSLLIR
jgi:hypothetical protein